MDEGAVISEQGIPVNSASDDQKVLDTRWVTLDIVAEPNYNSTVTMQTTAPGDGSTFGFTTSYIILYSHNLGFLPAFDYEIVSETFTGSIAQNTPTVYADAQNIYFIPVVETVQTSLSISLNINLRIYNLPITSSYQAPVVQGIPITQPVISEFGVKFLDQNSTALDIRDASIDNYSFNTQLRPLNILQHGTVTVSNGSIVINYTYDQHPFYLLAPYSPSIYTDAGGVSIAAPLVSALSFAGSRGTVTNNTISITGQQSVLTGSFAYILFKDPMDLV